MRLFAMIFTVSLLIPSLSMAADDEPKVVSGISIVGNDETPKSLYIVPWKSSELGDESDLAANLMSDGMGPVDKDVFMRQLDYYEISNTN